MVPFACPACHTPLADNIADLTCSACGQVYPITGNIPRFAPSDPFYEEARPGSGVYPAQYDKIRHGLKKILFPLYQSLHLNLRTQLFQDRILDRAEGTILDAGCGGGNGHLCRFGEVTGVDISVNALQEAGKVYAQTGQASLEQLPFADCIFNVIVCNHVLEHLHAEQKDKAFRELHRVLKPGGILTAAIPVRGDNIIFRKARQRPELFEKYFIRAVGHHGLESLADLKTRLIHSGFHVEEIQANYSVIWPVGTYNRFLPDEYRDDHLFALLTRIDRIFQAAAPLIKCSGDKLIHCGLGIVSRLTDIFSSVAAASLVTIRAKK